MSILVNSEKGKNPVSIRVLAVVCLSLLAVTVIASYLGYSTILELQTEQSNLQTKYDNLISQYLALQTNFNQVKNSSNDLQLHLTNLESQFSSMETQQSMLEANHSALQAQYYLLEANYASLEVQYEILELNYSALQLQHNKLQSNNSALQVQYDALEASYSILQSQHDMLEDDYSVLQTQYDKLQANYTEFLADYNQVRLTQFSYIVFTDGDGNYHAENGVTKTIEYSGTDLAAILNAVLNQGKTCQILPGEYYLNSPVNVFGKNDVSISGSELETSMIRVTSDICAFNITGTASDVHNARFTMSNIAINSTTTSTQPALFIKYMNDIKLSDLSINQFKVGYDIEYTEKAYIYRCKTWSNKTTFSTGFKFVGYSIDTFLIDTLVLHNQLSGTGYSFDHCDSITLINAIANPTVSSYGEGGYGFVFSNCHFVNLMGTISDGNGSHGYYLSSGFRYYFNSAWAGSNFGNGLQSDSASQISITGCSFYTNHIDGIKLSNSSSTTISNTVSKGNTKHGLEVSTTNGITVTSSVLTENGNNGIFLNSGNSYAIIQNNNCIGNLDPSFDIYITTPSVSSFSLVSNNFGRIYQTP
ncbi:MAG: right-handed parallel beta-helix repeat-containing protein [Candidatus Bathyarchaeota archaeon]|nr:right-handed parallel beta-helix repeat-containing protein [Candidatus Bathyarchaeum sp.]